MCPILRTSNIDIRCTFNSPDLVALQQPRSHRRGRVHEERFQRATLSWRFSVYETSRQVITPHILHTDAASSVMPYTALKSNALVAFLNVCRLAALAVKVSAAHIQAHHPQAFTSAMHLPSQLARPQSRASQQIPLTNFASRLPSSVPSTSRHLTLSSSRVLVHLMSDSLSSSLRDCASGTVVNTCCRVALLGILSTSF